MALENIAELEKTLGLESGKLNEMITSEENHTLDLTTKVIIDKAIYDERIANIKKESSTMTREILVKELRNEFELEFEGKTQENLINAFKTKLENVKDSAVKDPEKRFTDLKSDFEKLQKNFLEKDNEIAQIKDETIKKEKRNSVLNEVFKFIPENTLVSKNTILIEAEQKGFKFDQEEGVTVIKDAQGNILKDEHTLSPRSVKDFMESFVTPFLPKVEGGKCGNDETGNSKAGSFEAFMKEAEKQGWDNTKMNEEIAKRTKDGTLKL